VLGASVTKGLALAFGTTFEAFPPFLSLLPLFFVHVFFVPVFFLLLFFKTAGRATGQGIDVR
jgi:hypothetical protein